MESGEGLTMRITRDVMNGTKHYYHTVVLAVESIGIAPLVAARLLRLRLNVRP